MTDCIGACLCEHFKTGKAASGRGWVETMADTARPTQLGQGAKLLLVHHAR